MNKIFFLIFCFALAPFPASMQTVADASDFQSWNEVQVTIPAGEKFDLFFADTMRFGSNVSKLSDARFAYGAVYKPNKKWSFSPFHLYVRARNARGIFQTENRLNLRAGYRFPFKKFGLSHRSAFEYRIREPQNSWRYRPSITFEKELPKKIVSGARVFITEEIFYDSILKKLSRNRFSAGVSKTLTKKLSLDVYYMRQTDGSSRPGNLNVISTAWKIKL